MSSLFRREVTFDPTSPVEHAFKFVVPGGSRVTILAPSAQAALNIIRAEYGSRAHREAFLIEVSAA